jgi:hypothetical protein
MLGCPVHGSQNVIGDGAAVAKRIEEANLLIRSGRHARATRVLRETAWAAARRLSVGKAESVAALPALVEALE